MAAENTQPAVATIVAADAVDKLAALDVIARTVGAEVRGAATATPTISLADGVWAQIEIPKFGEPPPLAIDVYAAGGLAQAREHARNLAELLTRSTSWSITLMFED